MSKPKTWLLAGAALALLAGTGAAVAQPKKEAPTEPRAERHVHMRGPGAGPGSGPESGQGRMMVMRHGDPAQRLRDLLQLRPEQEPALKAFIAATRGDGERPGVARFDHDADRTTLDRLNDMEARMARHHAAMKTRIEATRTFYGQLDARQKKAFDAMPMLMPGAPGMGSMGMSHHMGHAMPMPPMPPQPPAPPPPPSGA